MGVGVKIYKIYCETTGAKAAFEDDHICQSATLKDASLKGSQYGYVFRNHHPGSEYTSPASEGFEEYGESDNFRGRRMRAAGADEVNPEHWDALCAICGEHIRRKEIE